MTINNIKRVLIFRGGALGDFLLTLPLLTAVRASWPQAMVELVGYPQVAQLALMAGLIHKVTFLESARFADYFSAESELPAGERDWLQSFDLIISCRHDPDGVWSRHVQSAVPGRLLSISPLVQSGHAADHFCRPLEQVGGRVQWGQPVRLAWPPAGRERGRRCLERLGLAGAGVALHPGSGSPSKNWPLDRFLSLAGSLRTRNPDLGQPLFIAGEAEQSFVGRLQAAGFPVLQLRPLEEVTGVLSACRGYIGNDSGITHLAAVLGLPVVALFGPTDPAVWGPRGAKVRLLCSSERSTAGLASLAVTEVLACLQTVMESIPLLS